MGMKHFYHDTFFSYNRPALGNCDVSYFIFLIITKLIALITVEMVIFMCSWKFFLMILCLGKKSRF